MAEPARIRVFQINRDRDAQGRCFRPLEPGQQVDASIYDEVYDGPVPSTDLDEIFHQFNTNPPPLHRGWSMSVSDIVEVDGKHLYVDSFGFQDVLFDASLTQKPEGLLRVVVVEPNTPAYIGELAPDLQSILRSLLPMRGQAMQALELQDRIERMNREYEALYRYCDELRQWYSYQQEENIQLKQEAAALHYALAQRGGA